MGIETALIVGGLAAATAGSAISAKQASKERRQQLELSSLTPAQAKKIGKSIRKERKVARRVRRAGLQALEELAVPISETKQFAAAREGLRRGQAFRGLFRSGIGAEQEANLEVQQDILRQRLLSPQIELGLRGLEAESGLTRDLASVISRTRGGGGGGGGGKFQPPTGPGGQQQLTGLGLGPTTFGGPKRAVARARLGLVA